MSGTISKTVSFVSLSVLFLLLLPACGSEEQSLPKNVRPVQLGFYETYTQPELQKHWQLACEMQEASDTNAMNGSVPIDELNKRKLRYLLNPNTQHPGIIGVVQKSDKEKVVKILEQSDIKMIFPPDIRFAWSADEMFGRDMYALLALKIPSGGKPFISGKDITDAVVNRDDQSGQINIVMTMTKKGQDKWALMTGKNIGRTLAILCDDQIVSHPIVNEAINGGNTQISGNFSMEEAEKLAAGIKAGR